MRPDRIVIVEDDPAMCEALRRLLTTAGFRVSGYPSAEALLESDAVSDAACLVLDVNLPGISGFELHRRLVASGSRPRVVFITAHEDDQMRDEAMHAGAEAFFTKPFPGRQLIEILRSILGTSHREVRP